MSFYISLSGLKGAQADLGAIANNIANVGSTAFKKSKVEFGDIFATSASQSDAAGGQGVRQIGATQQFTQGTLETTGKALDLAITGEGFFMVKSAAPANQISFTRNGAFDVDENRNVVDTLGSKVQVLPLDAYGRIASTDAKDAYDLRIPTQSSKSIPGSPYRAGSATIDNNTGVVTVSFENGTKQVLQPAVKLPTGNDAIPAATYQTGSAVIDITSGVVTVTYDDGNTLPLTPAVSMLSYKSGVDSNGNTQQYPLVSAVVSDAGVVTATYADGSTDTPSTTVTIPATHQFQPPFVSAKVGDDGVVIATFADNSQRRLESVTIPAENGASPPAQLSSVSVSVKGVVSVTYANGDTEDLGIIALANFPSQTGLRQSGDGHWTIAGDSGQPQFGEGNNGQFGAIRSGSLERSNVDITEELVALIAAQRNFQANSKALETASTMTQGVINLRS